MNQIIFNDEKITPSKVIGITPDTKTIYNKPNSTVTTILNILSEDNRLKSRICFLIKDEKIAGVGLGLDLKNAGISWESSKEFENSSVFSDFVSFDGDVSKLRHELLINDELQQEANYDLMVYKPEQMIEDIKAVMPLEDGDIIMSSTPKDVSAYEECDLFTSTVYCGDEILVEACWEAI